jgi:hypothetical protein
MSPAPQSGKPQLVEPIAPGNRKRGARVSPRQLSQLTRRLIYEEFVACGDIDQVAKSHHLPAPTINSVLHWFHARRGPQPERGAFGGMMRRSA